MKISLITKLANGFEMSNLLEEAKNAGVEIDVLSDKRTGKLDDFTNKIGDIVIWRGSHFGNTQDKGTITKIISEKIVINRGYITQPYIPFKVYQQNIARKYFPDKVIDTYLASSVDEINKFLESGILKFPFVVKPTLGSQGDGVVIIENQDGIEQLNSLDLKKHIIQNFVPNDGDFRVFIVGGVVLGIIKRERKSDKYLNNIAKGAEAIMLTDESLIKNLSEFALELSSLFELNICGVDLMINKDNGVITFLEINSVPNWHGFMQETGVNVGKKVIEYCLQLASRLDETKKPESMIHEYFYNNIEFFPSDKFHFLSRMALWFNDENAFNYLQDYKLKYSGTSESSLKEKLIKEMAEVMPDKLPLKRKTVLRMEYLKKYPNIKAYSLVLSKWLWMKNIYKTDISHLVEELLDKELVYQMFSQLLQDDLAIKILSTVAINFVYYCRNFYKEDSRFTFSPSKFLELGKSDYELSQNDLKIYLLTHAIIGESEFYNQAIVDDKETYLEMIKYLDGYIHENYFSISLDNKIEFLVCAKMLDFETKTKNLIDEEAKRSFSNLGNYLVDKINDRGFYKTSDCLYKAEHRNVLYLMSRSAYRFN